MNTCTCKSMCKSPGWMTPEEAAKAIAAGFAPRLMRDFYGDTRTYILCPASKNFEGKDAREFTLDDLFFDPAWCKGQCTFFNDDGLCLIHEMDFYPFQCRHADCRKTERSDSDPASNFNVAALWDTDAGRELVARWLTLVGRS